MKEAQNRSRRHLRSESDKVLSLPSLLSGEGTTTFIISGGGAGGGGGGGGGRERLQRRWCGGEKNGCCVFSILMFGKEALAVLFPPYSIFRESDFSIGQVRGEFAFNLGVVN